MPLYQKLAFAHGAIFRGDTVCLCVRVCVRADLHISSIVLIKRVVIETTGVRDVVTTTQRHDVTSFCDTQ